MIQELLPGLFQSKVPFPENPLRDINIYIIKGKERWLMVDNGMDLPVTWQELQADIKKIEMDLKSTDFFITHGHPDHCSNTGVLAAADAKVYLGHADLRILYYGNSAMQEKHIRRNKLMGVPEGNFFENNSFRPVHPMFEMAEKRGQQFISPEEGTEIQAGQYLFKCLHTPGHSPGHMCLYDAQKKLLLCGDHILQKITPGILPQDDNDNPLADYLQSLEKIKQLDIDLTLPAHRNIIKNVKARIESIEHHHEVRLNEILEILSQASLNPYQIASRMHWDVSYHNWEAFPIWQRMIATDEAEAHLRYLLNQNKIRVKYENEQAIYMMG
jgi:glyoxylase-like metal-dependent hydrolase (beta-lactamase superfamily II)